MGRRWGAGESWGRGAGLTPEGSGEGRNGVLGDSAVFRKFEQCQ